jgi:ribonuclease J
MRICIHRGTSEIGGTCIEIESQGQRVVLDVGMPLDAEPQEVQLYPIRGFEKPDASLLGVFISHPHADHYGLAHRLPAGTRFLIGKAAESILAAASVFVPVGISLDNVTHIENRKPITLGPFKLTPYLVDHSAYDAFAVLVEADGKRLFYSGDFRIHGRKAALVEELLRDPPKGVDVLLMEGTTIGRPDTAEAYPTEADLEAKFVDLFRQTPGMPLVWCSGQNIDRIVTIFRACKRTGRQFIIDMYTAHVLRATGNPNIPQAEWDGIKVFLPRSQKFRIVRDRQFDVSDSYKPYRVYPEALAAESARSVMLFRPSMTRDLEDADCLNGAAVICSIWRGYLEDEKCRPFLDWVRRHGLSLEHCHTSGHADASDLQRLAKAIAPKTLVPIHTDQPGRFDELFGNVQRQADGEWFEITPFANGGAL